MPWLVEVIEPSQPVDIDVLESAYAARLASRIVEDTGHEVSYDVLHDAHPARALVDYAERLPASLIFMCTHGRTGLARLRLGSVAAETVRHATCPVVLYRPPELQD